MSGPNPPLVSMTDTPRAQQSELSMLGGWRKDVVSAVSLPFAPGSDLITLVGPVGRVARETQGQRGEKPEAC